VLGGGYRVSISSYIVFIIGDYRGFRGGYWFIEGFRGVYSVRKWL